MFLRLKEHVAHGARYWDANERMWNRREEKKKSGASEELLQAKVYFRGAVEDALGKSAAPR